MMRLNEVFHVVMLLPELIKPLHLLFQCLPRLFEFPFVLFRQSLLLYKCIKQLRVLLPQIVLGLLLNQLSWLPQVLLLNLELLKSGLKFLSLLLRLLISILLIPLKPQILVSHRVILRLPPLQILLFDLLTRLEHL